MSAVSQGPGWWIASDGKWYPPHLHPSYRPPPPAALAAEPSGYVATPSGRTTGNLQRGASSLAAE